MLSPDFPLTAFSCELSRSHTFEIWYCQGMFIVCKTPRIECGMESPTFEACKCWNNKCPKSSWTIKALQCRKADTLRIEMSRRTESRFWKEVSMAFCNSATRSSEITQKVAEGKDKKTKKGESTAEARDYTIQPDALMTLVPRVAQWACTCLVVTRVNNLLYRSPRFNLN